MTSGPMGRSLVASNSMTPPPPPPYFFGEQHSPTLSILMISLQDWFISTKWDGLQNSNCP